MKRPELRLFLSLVAFSAVLLLLAACASIDPLNRRRDFKDIQREFAQSLRWGKIDQASEQVVPAMREDFRSLQPQLADFRLTDYEILSVDLADDLRKATVSVRFRGYGLSLPVERSVVVTENWSRDAQTGKWLVALDLARMRSMLKGAETGGDVPVPAKAAPR